jgi:hypothetical protein
MFEVKVIFAFIWNSIEETRVWDARKYNEEVVKTKRNRENYSDENIDRKKADNY